MNVNKVKNIFIIPHYHSGFYSTLEMNVNKVKNIFIIPHYHSGFYSTLEMNVNKAKNITTDFFKLIYINAMSTRVLIMEKSEL